MLQSSREQLRTKFKVSPVRSRRHVPGAEISHVVWDQMVRSLSCLQENSQVTESGVLKKLLLEGEEAASFIKSFVVQAKLNDRGNFGESTYSDFKLQLHLLDDTGSM